MFGATVLDLTLKGVLSNIPHDVGALVAYSILFLFVGLTWLGGRTKKQRLRL